MTCIPLLCVHSRDHDCLSCQARRGPGLRPSPLSAGSLGPEPGHS
jgi:hypothetical protein